MRKAQESSLTPWGLEKRLKWFVDQTVKRSYREDVLVRLEALRDAGGYEVESYGQLTLNPERFPLYVVRAGQNPQLPTVLLTGGVHGYETSGVKGALLFLEKHAPRYTAHYNFVVFPCISPWSYETINRLDPVMENPNRNFKSDSKAEESRLFMECLAGLGVTVAAHIDLHETTNSDKQFVPEEYAKNGLALDAKDVDIPDGFYLIGIKGTPRTELEKAMIASVRKVTHIAPPDARGRILDTPLSHEGVIHAHIPGLCAEYTDANSRLGAFTTEMYPDSERFRGLSAPQVEALCSEAQVACVRGALDHWLQ